MISRWSIQQNLEIETIKSAILYMIKPGAMQQVTRAVGVRDQQIEKDYVLWWAADFPGKLQERLPQYEGRWKNSLSGQIKDLPDFDKVEREV